MRRIDLAEGTSSGSVCVACQDRDSIHPHPLFEKHQLCDTCLEDFSQCAYLFGDDGAGMLCYQLSSCFTTVKIADYFYFLFFHTAIKFCVITQTM